MDSVLLDGTTLILSARLLSGEEGLSALHLFSLSLLVESAILHERVIVLDTTGDDRIPEAAARYGARAVTVERHSVDELVSGYIEREFPQLSSLSPSQVDELTRGLGTAATRRVVGRAESDIHETLRGRYWDDREMQEYLALLDAIHTDQAKRKERTSGDRFRKQHPTLAFLSSFALGRPHETKNQPHTRHGSPFDAVEAEVEIRQAWERFVERYTTAAGQSPWNYSKYMRRSEDAQFVPSLLMRTHFYLLASQVMDLPYRPDGLRTPICWKFFNRGSFADLGLEEAFVRNAERARYDEVDSLNRFLERQAFVGIPLFLARVLHESRDVSDVMLITQQIRESANACRFRENMARLRAEEERGNIAKIAGEVQRYAALLRKEFSGRDQSPDVVLSLIGSTAKASVLQDPSSLADAGVSAARAAVTGGQSLATWWRNRRLALISKTIRQARRAHDLQGELQRVFGAPLGADETGVLTRLERLGHRHER